MTATTSARLLWTATGVVLFVVAALLMPSPFQSRLMDRVYDALHLPTFACLTWFGLYLSDRFAGPRWSARILVSLVILAASGCIEAAQSLTGRSSSWHDMAANGSGVVTATLLFASKEFPKIRLLAARVLCVGLVVLVTFGPLRSFVDIAHQSQHPEVLAAFDSTPELERWYVDQTRLRIVDYPQSQIQEGSRRAMRAELFPGRFPAVQLQQMTRDWRPYREVEFEVARDPADTPTPLIVQLRIRDNPESAVRSRSYAKRHTLLPGESWHEVIRMSELFDEREQVALNQADMRYFEFFAIELQQPATILVGNIRLR